MAKSKDKVPEKKTSRSGAKGPSDKAPPPEAKKTKAGRKGAHPPVAIACRSCGDDPHVQDRLYGAGQRLHTVGEAKRTCTRCGVVTK